MYPIVIFIVFIRWTIFEFRTHLNVPEEMLHPNLLGLLRPDLRGHVLEGLGGGRPVIVDLLDHLVRLCGQTHPGGLGVDDDEDAVGAILPDQVVDEDVILMELWARVIPSNDPLLSIHFPVEFQNQ